ncbi:ATP-binding cassette domain-containing protein [bacterium]|nr:ATP-binding cassette domain-containing protein [bacterium]MBU1921526.1 ATP-binding cassette domain-containing protein [bacterium]
MRIRPTSAAPPNIDGIAVYARGLTRRFGNFTAVDGIDLEVKSGDIFGFLGANGAGKTTAIRMFCGLLAPSDGEAWVAGLSIRTHAEKVKRRIGYMSQKFSLYDDLTVRENLQFYGGVYGLNAEESRTQRDSLMERLNLTDLADKLPTSLPLGYKQRLALGCSILHHPDILFLDEPTGGVDPVARRTFWNLIYELSDSGVTVFVTTHYMDEAEYCNHLSIMDAGRIVALGAPGDLKQELDSESMQDVFLKVVKR